MRKVNQAIVKVLVAAFLRRDITVVNPDIGRLLDRDCVTIGGCDFCNFHVSDNDVLLSVDREADTIQSLVINISIV
jgi:hypothetical protein